VLVFHIKDQERLGVSTHGWLSIHERVYRIVALSRE